MSKILRDGSFFADFEAMGRNPAVLAKLRFLEFDHLRDEALRTFSAQFAALAKAMMNHLPDDAELTLALDQLRQVKDRAVGLAAITWPAPPATTTEPTTTR